MIFAQNDNIKQPSQKPSFNKVRDGIIHVGQKSEDKIKWLGTGFLVDDQCTFATAKHLFKKTDRDKIVIRFQVPQDRSKVVTLPARILYENDKTDIVFLKIDSINSAPCNSVSLHAFPLPVENNLDSLTGEPVMIVGYPRLSKDDYDTPILRSGIISSTEISWGKMKMLLTDLTGVPGFSGSPVILQRTGEVIGVVSGPGPTNREFGFEWATPLSKQEYIKAISHKKDP